MSVDLPVYGVRSGLLGELRPSQAVGIEFMAEHERVLVGDQMGTGKTPQALGGLWHVDAFPATIVVPASLARNWEREAHAWLDNVTVRRIREGGEDQPTSTPDITIVSYGLLEKYLHQLKESRAVVFDEAHYVKEPKKKRTLAAATIAGLCEYVWPMTGTPVVNRPAELISLLNMMRCLGEFGGWNGYTQRYCDRHLIPCPRCFGRGYLKPGKFKLQCKVCRGTCEISKWDGSSNLEELNGKLREGRYIRRLRSEVLPDLPGKLPPIIVPIELSNRSEYDRAADDLVKYLRDLGEDDRADRAERAKGAARFAHLRSIVAKGKAKAACEWVGEFLDGTGEDEKLVVFAHHIPFQEKLAEPFPGCATITGESPDLADAECQRFQNDPTCRLMVASLTAGGLGHTMTAAAHVAVMEYPTTPKDLDQAEDRLDRYGQTRAVQPYHLVAEGTIDDDLAALHSEKRAIINALVEKGDAVGADRALDDDLDVAAMSRMAT